MSTCTWPIGNNETLQFNIYTQDGEWNPVAGLYIFTYFDGQLWRPVYVGQADDFSNRLPNHERWDEARRFGATHVHAKVVPLAANRDTLETRLIAHLQPVLNKQKKAAYLETGL